MKDESESLSLMKGHTRLNDDETMESSQESKWRLSRSLGLCACSKTDYDRIYDKTAEMDGGTLVKTMLSQTSAHGLPRVVTSTSLLARILWAVLFIVSVTVLTLHLNTLLMHYVSQPVSFQFKHRAVNFVFPDFYICNPVAFSSSIYLRNVKSDRHSHRMIKNETIATMMLKGELVRELLLLDMETLKDSRWIKDANSVKITSFFSSANLSLLRSTKLHTKQQTIIRAVLNKEEVGLENFVEVPHREFLNCFRFINSSRLSTPEDELELYLFSDSQPQSIDDIVLKGIQYKGSIEFDLSSGIILLFSDKGSYPGSKAVRMTLSTGMKTDISVHMTEKRLINTYVHPCNPSKSTLDSISHLSSSGTDTISYNLDYTECVEYNLSLAFFKTCGCLPLHMPVPISLKNVKRCLNVNFWSIEEIAANIRCIYITNKNNTLKKRIEESCHGYDSCKQREYSLQWSNALWPSLSLVSSVIDRIIKPSYKDRIQHNYSVPGWESIIKRRNSSNITVIVRDSVAKVTIRPASEKCTLLIENRSYPIVYFMSDIGGVLGLYLGISLLTLFELIDILIALIIHLWRWVSKTHSQ